MIEIITPDQHYIPKMSDMPDIGEKIYSMIEVPVRKVPAKTFFRDKPFDVLATSWHWLSISDWGPMTKEKFLTSLELACGEFANQINEMEEMVCYPISNSPDGRYGVGYWDWCGQSYPIDIRLFAILSNDVVDPRYEDGAGNPVALPGLRFHITTLVEGVDDE